MQGPAGDSTVNDGAKPHPAHVGTLTEGQSALSPSLPELYLRHRKELVAFVRRKFGAGPPDPEDVAQQAFANFVALPAGSVVHNPRAFLYRTAHNIAINYCRREQVGRQFFEPAPAAGEIRQARDDFDPEIVQIGRQEYSLVEEAIRAMPVRRRQFLLLNRIEGLSIAEIARQAGLSESAVRKHIVLAVQQCGAVLLRATAPVGALEEDT